MPSKIEDGNSAHPLYRIWCAMKERCDNPNNRGFSNYGGRGIKVCERWSLSFRDFVKDMGTRPARYEIDRINNDGDYEPSNCRWVSHQTNSLNRRKNTPPQHARNRKMWQRKRELGAERRAARTKFKCGHPYVSENTYAYGMNRWCRICCIEKSKAAYRARKERKNAAETVRG